MAMLRAFIAIELPGLLQERLAAQRADMKAALVELPLRWVPIENIHLTLKFLGDVSEANIEAISDVIRTACALHAPMEISLEGMGLFPDLRRPRVVWIGVKAPGSLLQLQQRLEAECQHLGYPADERAFSPHLTLARVQRSAGRKVFDQIGDFMQTQDLGFLAAAVINQVALMKSELKPDGAVYTRLSAAPLSA